MLLFNELISKKIDDFYCELGRDYLAFFSNAALKKFHLKEMIHLLRYRYLKDRSDLSLQEKKCLLLSSKGKRIKEMASVLGLSERTIKHHRSNAIKKLAANNITEASLKFLENK
jgi:DNA-binding CsgD family transcriptional regulator